MSRPRLSPRYGRSNLVVSGEERVVLRAILAADTPYLLGETTGLPDRFDATVPSPADYLALRQLGERYAAAQTAMSDSPGPSACSQPLPDPANWSSIQAA